MCCRRGLDGWPEEDAARLFPDNETMRRFQLDEPRLRRAYYEQAVPAPSGWDTRGCAYLQYSDAYAAAAAEARDRGWPVVVLPGEHLHMLVDPAATANALIQLREASMSGPHADRGAAPQQGRRRSQ